MELPKKPDGTVDVEKLDRFGNRKILFACHVCGSTRVEVSAWVDPNTDELTDSEGPLDYAFCADCEDSQRQLEEIPAGVLYCFDAQGNEVGQATPEQIVTSYSRANRDGYFTEILLKSRRFVAPRDFLLKEKS